MQTIGTTVGSRTFVIQWNRASYYPVSGVTFTGEVTFGEIDYINAHATSSSIGDAVEAKAIRQVFKSRTDKIAVNATKSLVGHTLGAAGAIGGIASVLTIHSGHIHPTANYDEPYPDCLMGGISRSVQARKVKAALLNAFGFGSNNAAVVFKRLTRKQKASVGSRVYEGPER